MNRTTCYVPAGPYWLSLDSFERCSQEGSREMIFDLHLRKMNRTTVILYGNFTFKRDFDENMKMRLEASSWGNGGWRSNLYIIDIVKNICKTFYDNFGIRKVNYFIAKVGFPMNRTTCYVPANNYQVDDVVVSNSLLEAYKILIYSKYRTTASLFSAKDELLGCVRVVMKITRRYQ
ncbi:uncharacterized protein LOC120350908 isoform X2 [Nilaparvata lugens]|uniref:uncharacterized protein LOC120350908 isoform X2 n=1 Tax=Nilaparvata lugens TaxID=108931 RepID=UPI00193D0977|nr:uncharacterized protein LOC120350908 isoform X2 [Nilaparvata lugens]